MNIKCTSLSKFSELKHGYFHYNPKNTNQERMKALVGFEMPLVTLNQVHSPKALHVSSNVSGLKADGLVTKTKGLALGIATADCGPVLFYDPKAEVIGACHAGWRGAKAGIIKATLDEMEDLGANRSHIVTSIGPMIQQSHYEVGPEFPDLIGETYEMYFTKAHKIHHHFFNLPLYIYDLLLKEHVGSINNLNVNTFHEPYASRRRLLAEGKEHKKENNLSVIALI